MNKGFIQCTDTHIMLGLCGDPSSYVKKKCDDLVIELPVLWKKYFGGIQCVCIQTNAARFSRTRQLALAVNVLAKTYNTKIDFSRTEQLDSPKHLCGTTHVWREIVAPQYAQKPNITVRKKI